MKKSAIFIAVIAVSIFGGCVTGKKTMAEITSERERLRSEEARGAKLCVSAQFSEAKSELDFAEYELLQGNYLAAEEHLSREKKLAAVVSANADRCVPKDRDKDGILDINDLCPEEKGLAKFNGCPDSDDDGIPDKKDKCSLVKGVSELEGCPLLDADKDGITDDKDRCPYDAEDFDKFQDDDGCPDPDNDKDGIADDVDQCPNAAGPATNQGCPVMDKDKDKIPDEIDKCPEIPEDFDNFEDHDGCPDPDNDGDGMCEAWVTPEMKATIYKDICKEKEVDKCPDEAGVKENFGCPVLDSDNDGVPDIVDKCPAVPGIKEESGCPKKYQLIIVTETKIELKQTVFFETGKAKIEKQSFAMLKEVADAIKSAPSIKKVVIEGHTDNVGNRESNIKLSQMRADSVKDFLIKEGVDSSKLEAIGYGPDKPISSNATKKGQAKNRRVEFKIEQK